MQSLRIMLRTAELNVIFNFGFFANAFTKELVHLKGVAAFLKTFT